MQRLECIRLTPDEAAVYDSGDDIAGSDLSRALKARARETLVAGARQVEIVHPDGFVIWIYDLSDLRANGGTI